MAPDPSSTFAAMERRFELDPEKVATSWRTALDGFSADAVPLMS